MKTCPVVGCDRRIHDAEVVCHGCLNLVSHARRSEFNTAWRAFARSFSADDMAAYQAAIAGIITDAGRRRAPTQLPIDGT